jgi:hypothetical protein
MPRNSENPVFILAPGTWGDVNPYLLIAQKLQEEIDNPIQFFTSDDPTIIERVSAGGFEVKPLLGINIEAKVSQLQEQISPINPLFWKEIGPLVKEYFNGLYENLDEILHLTVEENAHLVIAGTAWPFLGKLLATIEEASSLVLVDHSLAAPVRKLDGESAPSTFFGLDVNALLLGLSIFDKQVGAKHVEILQDLGEKYFLEYERSNTNTFGAETKRDATVYPISKPGSDVISYASPIAGEVVISDALSGIEAENDELLNYFIKDSIKSNQTRIAITFGSLGFLKWKNLKKILVTATSNNPYLDIILVNADKKKVSVSEKERIELAKKGVLVTAGFVSYPELISKVSGFLYHGGSGTNNDIKKYLEQANESRVIAMFPSSDEQIGNFETMLKEYPSKTINAGSIEAKQIKRKPEKLLELINNVVTEADKHKIIGNQKIEAMDDSQSLQPVIDLLLTVMQSV